MKESFMLSAGSLRVYTIVWMQFCEEQVSAATIDGESFWATKFEVVGSFAKWEGEGNASNGENNTALIDLTTSIILVSLTGNGNN